MDYRSLTINIENLNEVYSQVFDYVRKKANEIRIKNNWSVCYYLIIYIHPAENVVTENISNLSGFFVAYLKPIEGNMFRTLIGLSPQDDSTYLNTLNNVVQTLIIKEESDEALYSQDAMYLSHNVQLVNQFVELIKDVAGGSTIEYVSNIVVENQKKKLEQELITPSQTPEQPQA